MAADLDGAALVHSHTWYANLAGHVAKLLHGVPHVATTHSLEPSRPWKAEQLGGGYRLSSCCERTALEAADAVIAVSTAMREDVLAAYPTLDPARVHVIRNGIDTTQYQPVDARDALERYGVRRAAVALRRPDHAPEGDLDTARRGAAIDPRAGRARRRRARHPRDRARDGAGRPPRSSAATSSGSRRCSRSRR